MFSKISLIHETEFISGESGVTFEDHYEVKGNYGPNCVTLSSTNQCSSFIYARNFDNYIF